MPHVGARARRARGQLPERRGGRPDCVSAGGRPRGRRFLAGPPVGRGDAHALPGALYGELREQRVCACARGRGAWHAPASERRRAGAHRCHAPKRPRSCSTARRRGESSTRSRSTVVAPYWAASSGPPSAHSVPGPRSVRRDVWGGVTRVAGPSVRLRLKLAARRALPVRVASSHRTLFDPQPVGVESSSLLRASL